MDGNTISCFLRNIQWTNVVEFGNEQGLHLSSGPKISHKAFKYFEVYAGCEKKNIRPT